MCDLPALKGLSVAVRKGLDSRHFSKVIISPGEAQALSISSFPESPGPAVEPLAVASWEEGKLRPWLFDQCSRRTDTPKQLAQHRGSEAACCSQSVVQPLCLHLSLEDDKELTTDLFVTDNLVKEENVFQQPYPHGDLKKF